MRIFPVEKNPAHLFRTSQLIPITPGVLNGVVGWHKRAPAAPRPLYGLNRLATMPDAPVLVCEGEKAADAVQEMFAGFVCVSWMGGAKAVANADWTPLKGRNVILWPDADPEVKRAVAEISEILPQVQTLYVEDLEDGHDAADVHPDDAEAWLRDRLHREIGFHPKIPSKPQSKKPSFGSMTTNGRRRISPFVLGSREATGCAAP